VRDAGGEVIHADVPIREHRHFAASLRRVVQQGEFDVVDSHHDVMSALYFWAIRGAEIPARIVHVHNTALALPTPNRLKKAVAGMLMRQYCLSHATDIVGVSIPALLSLTQGSARNSRRDQVVHCGIDADSFLPDTVQRRILRAQLGVADDVIVVLFCGRMIPYKNPEFVVDVLVELHAMGKRALAVFAGEGPSVETVSNLAARKGLTDNCRLIGWQDNPAGWMHASDALLCPSEESPVEGLGLGAVEAQASGLPVVISLGVPAEAIVVPAIARQIPLSGGPAAWAHAVIELTSQAFDRATAASVVARSSYALRPSADELVTVYERAVRSGSRAIV
jgi:glycosyltransferase EpsF